ncbi:glyoxysomal fatty acid beta-oxidation multifunctional protein MFP-a-like [Apium graveolens]|uniref:glyoxysomal fatty acid beta-oxidation multifunctional protein MFP-a-like n=1 Tax=Apium graveolens TaxID=4045 RepID=UPI003D7BBCCF
MEKTIKKTVLEVGADGVGIITITNPPLNLVSVDVLLSLKKSIEEAVQHDDIKALVIIGSQSKFSAGADVTTFGKSQGKKAHAELGFLSIDFATDTLEAARKPIVAAIDGPAFGGGLEIALACHARISTSSALLGLTELQYGILPGLGGTQRLPRLVGLPKALEMIMMSKRLSGKDALKFGLVDAIAPSDKLLSIARHWALDILDYRRPWVVSLYKNDRLEPLAEARIILNLARSQAREQTPNLTHPLVCIDVIEEGIVAGPRSGLWKEAEALLQLRQSDTCKALVHFFFAQRATLKIPGVTDMGLSPRKINKVAIFGGGLMGSGIATVFLLGNYHVILKEVDRHLLSAGLDRVKANLQSHAKKGKITKDKLETVLSQLKGVLDYDSFKDVDLVIEAVLEDVTLKQKVFADLEKYCPQHCIFSSNTSSINLDRIGEKTKSQNRILGAHFFSPAQFMPLLEIIRTERTSLQVLVDLLDVSKKIRKTAVVVGNCTGFAVNRMFFPFSQAATLLVERGADIYQIDQAITNFGMPMGPFRLADLVGFRVAIASGSQYIEKFPERVYKSYLIPIMLEDRREGQSTRKGFYLYDEKRKASPDPEIVKFVEKARRRSQVIVDPKLSRLSAGEIVEMLFFPVVNEACRILAEGVAVRASDLDIASVLGRVFPAYRGGIIFWANFVGSRYICSRLEDWSKVYGKFFEPCPYLAEHAMNEIPLGTETKHAPRL